MIDILNIPHGDLLPCKFEWGGSKFFISHLVCFFFLQRIALKADQNIFNIVQHCQLEIGNNTQPQPKPEIHFVLQKSTKLF